MLMIVQLLIIIVFTFILIRWLLRKLRIRFHNNKYVFITGCDTGFGNLLAKRLDRLKFHVFAGCLTPKGAKDLKEACSSSLVTIQVDVSDESSIQNALEQVKRKLPKDKGLWAIVNNAGITGSIGPTEWLSADDFRKVLAVNLFGVILVAKAFLPLVRRERGRIVNMASIMGRISLSTAPYSTSKFAIEGFSDQLRRELKRTGVTVHIVEPGYFGTGIVSVEGLRNSIEASFLQASEEIKQYYGTSYKNTVRDTCSTLIPAMMSSDLYKVVDAYEHAITARFPKARYVVGWDAQILYRLLWNLPEWLSDYIVTLKSPTPEGARSA